MAKGAPKGHKKYGGGMKTGQKTKKTLEQTETLELMREKITERMFGEDGLLKKKFELANGVYVMKPIKVDGVVVDVKVYKEKPDSQSLEYLFSMVVGKPSDKMDLNIHSKDIKELAEAIKKLAKK